MGAKWRELRRRFVCKSAPFWRAVADPAPSLVVEVGVVADSQPTADHCLQRVEGVGRRVCRGWRGEGATAGRRARSRRAGWASEGNGAPSRPGTVERACVGRGATAGRRARSRRAGWASEGNGAPSRPGTRAELPACRSGASVTVVTTVVKLPAQHIKREMRSAPRREGSKGF